MNEIISPEECGQSARAGEGAGQRGTISGTVEAETESSSVTIRMPGLGT